MVSRRIRAITDAIDVVGLEVVSFEDESVLNVEETERETERMC
jgi:hypothetical protein